MNLKPGDAPGFLLCAEHDRELAPWPCALDSLIHQQHDMSEAEVHAASSMALTPIKLEVAWHRIAAQIPVMLGKPASCRIEDHLNSALSSSERHCGYFASPPPKPLHFLSVLF